MKKLFSFENFIIFIAAITLTVILFLPSKGLSSCPYGRTVDLVPGGSCPYFIAGKDNLCRLASNQINLLFFKFDFSLWFPFFLLLLFSFISILILFSKSVKIKTEGRFLLLGVSFVSFYFLFSKICPIKTLQVLLWQKDLIVINFFSFLIFLIPLFLALAFGRVFCSFVCPIGAIQEIFFRLPRCQKPSLDYFKLPKFLTLLPFLILAILSLVIFKLKSPVFCQLDPFSFIFCKNYSLLFLLFTVCSLLLAVFIFRPFCQLFCPYGAILKILSKISLFGLKIDHQKCIKCHQCEKSCPVLAIDKEKLRVDSCFLCADCYKKCQAKAIKFSFLSK